MPGRPNLTIVFFGPPQAILRMPNVIENNFVRARPAAENPHFVVVNDCHVPDARAPCSMVRNQCPIATVGSVPYIVVGDDRAPRRPIVPSAQEPEFIVVDQDTVIAPR